MNPYHPHFEQRLMMTRRQLFGRSALGLGTAAMANLLGPSMASENAGPAGTGTHHHATAKRVIYLFMSGGPSHHDTWDYKPKMREMFGQDLPEHVRDGQRITGMTAGQKTLPVCPSKYRFTKQENNDSGVWVSELLPHTATVAKDLCVVHSTFTEAINHDPAITYIQTGSQIPGRPSLGAWLSYGLGSPNENLPGYVVMHAQSSFAEQSLFGRPRLSYGLGSPNENLPGYVVMHAQSSFAEQSLFGRLWGSGFLPSDYQGVLMRSQGDPVLYLNNPAGVTRQDRRAQLDALVAINQAQHQRFADPEVLSRIKQHEMAYRMQMSVPELMDLSQESESTFALYGEEARKPGTFSACCLNARRLAERGVRNIQIFHRGWDAHGNLPKEHESQCKDVDQGCAALIKDLKQRGMLEDTLVVWGGEFGRTAYCQGRLTPENYGRDHHPRCFTVWMAGGGVKPGITYGKTDDYGYNIADADGNPILPQPTKDHWTPGTMHIHDLNATILHLLGIDHRRLTYRYQGRDFRLTDIHGRVMKELIA